MARVAFDVDGTLWQIVKDEHPSPIKGVGITCGCGMAMKQQLNSDLMEVLRFHVLNFDEVYIWSAGGVPYAQMFVDKWLPKWKKDVKVIEKAAGQGLDLCYDDQEVSLATVNVKVSTDHADHWQ